MKNKIYGGIVLACLLLSGMATAATMTVVSDTSAEYSADGTSGWAPAVACWVHPSWAGISDATWIWRTYETDAAWEYANAPEGGWYFRESFDVPQCASGLSGTIQVNSDNAYTIGLNGASLGGEGSMSKDGPDTQGWSTVVSYPLTGLVTGTNTIGARAVNYFNSGTSTGNPAGLIFKADITYTPFESEATTCGVGACAAVGTTSCVDGKVVDSCSPGIPAENDATCNGVDDDCNGQKDEDYVSITSCYLPGVCATGNKASTCVAGTETPCSTGTPDTEICADALDNDCDGLSDCDDTDSCPDTDAACDVEECRTTELKTLVQTVPVSVMSYTSTVGPNLMSGVDYILKPVGTYRYGGGTMIADAEYSNRPSLGWRLGEDIFAPAIAGALDVMVDGQNIAWGGYNTAHTYNYKMAGTGAPVSFIVFDSCSGTTPGCYSDNSGPINVNVYVCDQCPADSNKLVPGVCDCGVVDDQDGDGYYACQDDCDDNNPAIHPGAAEICNGVDDDCNELTDTDDPDIEVAPAAENQNGVCVGSDKVCRGADGWVEPDYSPEGGDTPPVGWENPEMSCDGLDNNCNGATDEMNWCLDCTLTQGYWKTHSQRGPAPYDNHWTLVEGGQQEDTPFFGQTATWYDVFWTAPSGGNVYYQLAHQYMAAKLNVLSGVPDTSLSGALAHADGLLSAWTPEQIAVLKGKAANAVSADFKSTAATLASFNEGTIGPGHCDDQEVFAPLP